MNIILAIVVVGVVFWLLDDDDGPEPPLRERVQAQAA